MTFEEMVRAALAGPVTAGEQERARHLYQSHLRQQQWQRGHANPFTQAPAVRSAVAAEAYQGTVIEGTSRHVSDA